MKGVGPAKSDLLNKMGIYKIKDLIEYYPRSYEDRTKLYKINQFVPGEYALFMARVNADVHLQRIRKNLTISTTFANDETQNCKITFFNQTYVKDRIKKGAAYLFYGKGWLPD